MCCRCEFEFPFHAQMYKSYIEHEMLSKICRWRIIGGRSKKCKFCSEGFENALDVDFISHFTRRCIRHTSSMKCSVKFADGVLSEAAVKILAM